MAAAKSWVFLALTLSIYGSFVAGTNHITINKSAFDGSYYEVFDSTETAALSTTPQMVAVSGCKFIIVYIEGSGSTYTLHRRRVSCDLKTDDASKQLESAASPTYAVGVTTNGEVYGMLYFVGSELYYCSYSYLNDAAQGSAIQITPTDDGTLTYENPILVGINKTHFVAAWNTYDGTHAGQIYYNLISTTGTLGYSAPEQVSEEMYEYYMSNPRVAVLTNGSFIFFWQATSTTNWQMRAKVYTSKWVQQKNSYILYSTTFTAGTVSAQSICGAIGISDAGYVATFAYTESGETNTHFQIARVSHAEEVSLILNSIEKNTYGLPFKYYNLFGLAWTSVYTNDTMGIIANIYAATGEAEDDQRTLAWNAGLNALVVGTNNHIYALFSEYEDAHASASAIYFGQVYNQTLMGENLRRVVISVIGFIILTIFVF